jgi:hypothetical protein
MLKLEYLCTITSIGKRSIPLEYSQLTRILVRSFSSPDVSHLLGSRGGRRPASLPLIGGILSNKSSMVKSNHRCDLSDDDFQYSAIYPEEVRILIHAIVKV